MNSTPSTSSTIVGTPSGTPILSLNTKQKNSELLSCSYPSKEPQKNCPVIPMLVREKGKNEAVRDDLYKTRICRKGVHCEHLRRRDGCNYAYSEEELRKPPDTRKYADERWLFEAVGRVKRIFSRQ
uniref:Uncharacterized protein n=1 Tax=Steinernema glaseri TaxID=37863 RepID=A0A1I7ZJH5_9BILA